MAHSAKRKKLIEAAKNQLPGQVPDEDLTALGLTPKQELFCNEYLVDLNATQAAIRAMYSPDTAYSIGWTLLKKVEVQQRIFELREKTGKGFNITRERVAQEYAKLAFHDLSKIYNEDGSIKPIHEMDADARAAIEGVEVEEIKIVESNYDDFDLDDEGNIVDNRTTTYGRTKKVKLATKTKALDGLAKMMGFNAADKLALTDPDGNNVVPVINITVVEAKKS